MKFGAKLLDAVNINHFTHIISTVSKLCAKSSNDKSCVLKLTEEMIYFILPEGSANNLNSGGSGRVSFWMSVDPKFLFDFYVCEGKSAEENFILLEIQPEVILQAFKSSSNIKMIRVKLTKRQTPCMTIELDLHSLTTKINSRTITHDIPIKVISTSKISAEDFQEPNISRTTLSIQLPPLKLLKHMIERMKCISEFVYLEGTDQGTLTLKIDADAVSVASYFRNLNNLPLANRPGTHQHPQACTVRLSLKKLHEFVNSLQFQPSKMICNFVNQKYAHFFVVHDEDLILQYLISSVFNWNWKEAAPFIFLIFGHFINFVNSNSIKVFQHFVQVEHFLMNLSKGKSHSWLSGSTNTHLA